MKPEHRNVRRMERVRRNVLVNPMQSKNDIGQGEEGYVCEYGPYAGQTMISCECDEDCMDCRYDTGECLE